MNFVGNHKIRLNVTESTNSSLKNMAKNLLLPEGTLLVTDLQTKGRGQMDSGWVSEEFKNFTGTYLLKPNIELENSFLINLIISLAVKSVIEDYVSDEKSVKIKWPNDILIDRKKVAGILIENQVKSKYISNSFIGIGINVNQISFPVFKRKATSIAVETKKHVLIDELIDIKKLHSATAIMNVKKDAFYVNGHFPGNPVMPGVLIVEAFGQAAARRLFSQ